MKILHTSDWHLGRTLRGADLTPAFEQWAEFVVRTVRERKVDAVLISGDVYDRGVPPVAMVDLLSRTLAQLAELAHVVVTAGNHDSAKRLGFGSALMRPELAIRTDSRDCGKPVLLPDASGELGAVVYALPYLDPDVERRKLAPAIPQAPEPPAGGEGDTTGEGDESRNASKASEAPPALLTRSHEAVVGAALELVRADIIAHRSERLRADGEPAPCIIMAHEFVVGGEPSDSELDIHVGGVDSVPASIFDLRGDGGEQLVDYVALGHLHGPQRVDRHGPKAAETDADGPIMRYSGSPVAFSFSEEKHKKSAALLDFSPESESSSRAPSIELIAAPVYRKLSTIHGTLAELTSGAHAAAAEDFVRAIVTDRDRPADLAARIREHFPNALLIEHDHPQVQARAEAVALQRSDPLAMLREFFAASGGRELSSEEAEVLAALWEEHAANAADTS